MSEKINKILVEKLSSEGLIILIQDEPKLELVTNIDLMIIASPNFDRTCALIYARLYPTMFLSHATLTHVISKKEFLENMGRSDFVARRVKMHYKWKDLPDE